MRSKRSWRILQGSEVSRARLKDSPAAPPTRRPSEVSGRAAESVPPSGTPLSGRPLWRRRDLRIVGNQVVSSKRGGNIAQRSAPPRGRPGLFFVGPVEGDPTVRPSAHEGDDPGIVHPRRSMTPSRRPLLPSAVRRRHDFVRSGSTIPLSAPMKSPQLPRREASGRAPRRRAALFRPGARKSARCLRDNSPGLVSRSVRAVPFDVHAGASAPALGAESERARLQLAGLPPIADQLLGEPRAGPRRACGRTGVQVPRRLVELRGGQRLLQRDQPVAGQHRAGDEHRESRSRQLEKLESLQPLRLWPGRGPRRGAVMGQRMKHARRRRQTGPPSCVASVRCCPAGDFCSALRRAAASRRRSASNCSAVRRRNPAGRSGAASAKSPSPPDRTSPSARSLTTRRRPSRRRSPGCLPVLRCGCNRATV